MAVNDTMDAPRRRLVFGFNVVLQGLLAAVVVIGAVWAAERFRVQTDLTGARRNSLSSRTLQLLKGLDQNIRVTAVFAEPDKRDIVGQNRRRGLQDLLDLYQAAGGARVTTAMVDPSTEKGRTDKLLQRLLELPAYRDEARPHQEALASFTDLSQRIQTLAAGESQRVEELTKGDPQLERQRNLAIVRLNLGQTARDAQDIVQKVEDLVHGEVPRFGQAVREVREFATSTDTLLRDALHWMTTEGPNVAGVTPELRTFFQEAQSRYDPLLSEIQALVDEVKDLKEVKVEEVYNGLTRWRSGPPVLVESEKEARLVAFWDLWVPQSDPRAPLSPDGDDRQFAGESAISSAILQLTRKDKTAVLFVHYGGGPLLTPDFSQMNQMMMRQMPRAPYQELNQLLGKASFETAEWDVQKQKTPPTVEGAARTVYVVLPPEPPPQQNPMQPPQGGITPADRKLILDAVDGAGLAVFLAGWTAPTSPMARSVGAYEFADYLQSTWGVAVEADHLTLHFAPHPEKQGLWYPAGQQPQLITNDDVVRLTDHAISAPLRNDRAGFVLTAPLKLPVAESMPAGVKIDVIAEVRKSSDVWACGDVMALQEEWRRTQGVRPGSADIAAPFPIAVAATKETGDGQPPKRVVVFGSEQFASDEIAQASGFQQIGKKLVLGALYPANSDLFVNTLHWLTGEQGRIAVGPQKGDLPRLRDLDEAWAARLPWLLVGVWPALALVIGITVWTIRRK